MPARIFSVALVLAAGLAALPATAVAQTARSQYAAAGEREAALRNHERPPLRTVRQVVRAYEAIALRYPTSGYTDDALWKAAGLAADAYAWYSLRSDLEHAERLYRWLAREYPHSQHYKPAIAALARLKSTAERATPAARSAVPAAGSRAAAPTDSAGPAEPTAPETAEPDMAPSGHAVVQRIWRSVEDGVERLVIEIDGPLAYDAQTLDGPPRLFFDFPKTWVPRSMTEGAQQFDGEIIRQVRVGRHADAVTRVVLDLARHGSYTVHPFGQPNRLVVAFAPPSSAAPTPSVPPAASPAAPSARATSPVPAPFPAPSAATPSAPTPPPSEPAVATGPPATPRPASAHPAPAPPASARPTPVEPVVDPTELRADSLPRAELAPAPVRPDPLPQLPALTPAPQPPSANAKGGFSLARQLGLGVSRIVIDPGHGGHDPGTLAGGLTEASVVLDIGLRLEALLKQDERFDVVLTRRTDVFVPLEERTAFANKAAADLFLSIHINSSRNRAARGIETYYLNFASDPAAEEVAARENSASGRTMHSLPGIVQAIALNNKLDESRDFATVVQDSMLRHLKESKSVRDRGVRRAPFVVLIGAGMPSALAEVSFISNAEDRQLLKTPAYRQRIAQALFEGILDYQRSLKSQSALTQP
jgi:N-acetylmuramoyl-L-alanine amidase